MFRRRDGKLLRTKLVATLGDLRHEMFDPSGASTAFDGSEGDWDTFLKWFARDESFIIDVIRLNLSFYEPLEDGSPDPDCKELKILRWLSAHREEMRDVAVLGDLPGPKLRLLGVGDGVRIAAGESVELRLTGALAGPTICAYGKPVAEEDEGIARRLEEYRAGAERPLASIGDGMATLRITEVTRDAVMCVALEDGLLGERKGVTFKGLSLSLGTFQEDDRRAVDFLLERAIDWTEHPWRRESTGSFVAFFALSFVRCAEDVERAKRYIEDRVVEKLRPLHKGLDETELRAEARNFAPGVIAKIETREATEDIERILEVADGAMVARGDLALQIGPQNVPSFQKRVIRLCNLRGKPVITATQMLSTMVNEPEPTRAEASDVFNAILDGTDAVMLSDETAAGKYPHAAVRTMIDIAEAAERHLEGPARAEAIEQLARRRLAERHLHDMVLDSEEEMERTSGRLSAALERARASDDAWLEDVYREKLERAGAQKITDEISAAACAFASSGPDYRAIVAPTTSGRTARMISRFRPGVTVLACAHDVLNHKKLVMSFGVYAVNCGRLGESEEGLIGDSEGVYETATGILVSRGVLASGDLIVWTSGSSLFVPGTTDLIKIRRIE